MWVQASGVSVEINGQMTVQDCAEFEQDLIGVDLKKNYFWL